jgi:hypothetical protein
VPPPLVSALSQAQVQVQVPPEPGRPAQVKVQVTVHVLQPGWVGVPLLPVGTALASASLAGQPISLGERDGQLIWAVQQAGVHQIDLDYTVAVTEGLQGRSLHLPVPAAASLNLVAVIPGNGLKVAVVPASGVEVVESGETSEVRASLPRTAGVQLNWFQPSDESALVIGADYRGRLQGEVVAWTAILDVKVLNAQPVDLPLLDAASALSSARVDDKSAVVREVGDQLAVRLQGVGRHRVVLTFETAVQAEAGPPGTSLWLPRPPVGSFSLDLPGNKELSVTPRAGVTIERRAGRTQARVHLPPSEQVAFHWSEALPATIQERLQANAEIYHVVRAEEGVVQIQAIVAFQVTRGATNVLTAELPGKVAVNQVSGEGVTDWRVVPKGKAQELTIYLDRDVKAELRYQVDYELLLGSGAESDAEPVAIPLLQAGGTLRQRGMLALLSGSELSMQPQQADGMNKVGENQLPAWVRAAAQRSVAHTYKYIDPQAGLTVRLAPPERQRGKFDAVVDTLYSVGDGVMKASASVEIAIKTGKLMDLDLNLPEGVNLVGVTAPSLRDHKLIEGQGSARALQLMFTQEMEGTLRIEVAFERVLAGGQEQVVIPAIHVPGADMEQGRLAIEALTAVEVQTAEAQRVLPLDVQELPRQLTLRTTNPILLAYKYVHAEPAFRLVLEVRHHAEMKVQVAAIDRAAYETLFTRHGLALTRAVYHVRNRRKQFLKVQLPQDSELWSAALNGQPIKPARSDQESTVLVPLVNSDTGFQVEIVFATSIAPFGFAGTIEGLLPVPDIVETRSRWDVFLPDELSYSGVDTNMSLSAQAEPVDLGAQAAAGFRSPQALDAQPNATLDAAAKGSESETSGRLAGERSVGVLPLQVEVPRRGVHFQFEKLFANRGDERSRFSIRYSTAAAGRSGDGLLILGGLAMAFALLSMLGAGRRIPRGAAAGLAAGGLVASIIAVWLLGAGWIWLLAAFGLVAAGYAVRRFAARA